MTRLIHPGGSELEYAAAEVAREGKYIGRQSAAITHEVMALLALPTKELPALGEFVGRQAEPFRGGAGFGAARDGRRCRRTERILQDAIERQPRFVGRKGGVDGLAADRIEVRDGFFALAGGEFARWLRFGKL